MRPVGTTWQLNHALKTPRLSQSVMRRNSRAGSDRKESPSLEGMAQLLGDQRFPCALRKQRPGRTATLVGPPHDGP